MIILQGMKKIKIENKNKKNICIKIDIDGVMSDWLKGCCEVCELDSNNEEFRSDTKAGIEVPDIKSNDITQKEMWGKIVEMGSSWWKDLDVLPWANDLIELANKYGEVAFLSSPGNLNKFPESVAEACKGKMEWVYKYFKEIPVILCRDKHLCASSNSILIDDSKVKVDKFIEYGGQSFHWPNQYKLMDGEVELNCTFKKLEEKLKKMKG